MNTVEYHIPGLDCVNEAAALRAEFKGVESVKELSFDFTRATMIVTFGEGAVSHELVRSAAKRAGMEARPNSEKSGRTDDFSAVLPWWRTHWRELGCGLFVLFGVVVHAMVAGPLVAFGFKDGGEDAIPPAVGLFYLLGIACAGIIVGPRAARAFVKFRFDMNVLMTLAVVGALFLGEILEAAMVSLLFVVSLGLESWSVGRARRAIGALLAVAPAMARVRRPDLTEVMVPVESVDIKSLVLVSPGERIPLDGRMIEGRTSIDESPITGESMPVTKSPGDEVFAGTINGEGAFSFQSTAPASDTTLARIIAMVRDAHNRRAETEQWVEKFARWYTPAVMVLALLVAAIPPVLGGAWEKWFYEALVLLVIACPCALVISTPVSIVAALACAARNGVLIKGGRFLEAAAHVKAIALDKTGTITMGRPKVVELFVLDPTTTSKNALSLASSLESRSEHVVARAVLDYTGSLGIKPEPISDYRAVPGLGAIARLDSSDDDVWAGSLRFVRDRIGNSEWMPPEKINNRNGIYIGRGTDVIAFFEIADSIRSNAESVVTDLKSLGLREIVMLTGDQESVARSIASQAGIDSVLAGLMPEAKVAAIEDLTARFHHVAMVGDGINDAPALALAGVSIAMGRGGTHAALETADIALMHDDLAKIPWLIRHGRRTLAIIRQNIAFALGVKLLFVVMTLAGLASLWGAIAADTGVSVLVTLNALRLLGDRSLAAPPSDGAKPADALPESCACCGDH